MTTGEAPTEPDRCWKTIGVWGREQPRCPRLSDVIHCRNCDVFVRNGRALLDRELPDAYRREWTEIMASEKAADRMTTLSLVIFRIEDEWLALRSRIFSEIIDPEGHRLHSIPHRKNRILTGIINVRGEIQLCVSIRELLGIEGNSNRPEGRKNGASDEGGKIYRRMMVIDSEDGKWVFPVDEILGIYRVHPGSFQNVPVTVAKAQSTYTKGIFRWEQQYVAHLDDELLVYSLTRSVQ